MVARLGKYLIDKLAGLIAKLEQWVVSKVPRHAPSKYRRIHINAKEPHGQLTHILHTLWLNRIKSGSSYLYDQSRDHTKIICFYNVYLFEIIQLLLHIVIDNFSVFLFMFT